MIINATGAFFNFAIILSTSKLELYNCGEVSSLQGSTTNQSTVNVWLSHEILNSSRLYRTAILDADSISSALAKYLSYSLTDSLAYFLSLLEGSSLAGTDSPDWLISDNQLSNPVSGEAIKSSLDLLYNIGC